MRRPDGRRDVGAGSAETALEPLTGTLAAYRDAGTQEHCSLGADREAVRLALEKENIESRPVWKPMHLQPVFAGCRAVGGAVSEDLFARGLCLPSGTAMTEGDLGRVVEGVKGEG